MSPGVVHLLEVVDVQHQQGKRLGGSAGRIPFCPEEVQAMATIGQLREGIGRATLDQAAVGIGELPRCGQALALAAHLAAQRHQPPGDGQTYAQERPRRQV
ncbi:MAG: hypothetical protein U1E96_00510 [Azonexus sp.]